MDMSLVESLVEKLRKKIEAKKAETPAPKPVATAATSTATVVRQAELARNTHEAFEALAQAGESLRKVSGAPEHKRGDELRAEIAELTAGISAVKAEIRGDAAAYPRYLAEVMVRGPEALEEMYVLAERGVLSEISDSDAKKVEEGWAEFHRIREAGKSVEEIEAFRRDNGLQKVFYMPERQDWKSPVRYRCFVKKHPAPDGAEGVMQALASRYRYWEEGDRRTEQLANRLAEQFGVGGTQTLVHLSRGETCVVAAGLYDEAWWVDRRSGGLLSPSVIFLKGYGVGNDGVASMELVGAAGQIWPSLRHHAAHEKDGEKIPATVFGYVPGRGFEGMVRRAPDGKWGEVEEKWLISLLRAIGGPALQPSRNMGQFRPQTRRGQTNLAEGEHRKNSSGGRGGRAGRRERGGSKRRGAEDYESKE